jgi:hypothetical protein
MMKLCFVDYETEWDADDVHQNSSNNFSFTNGFTNLLATIESITTIFKYLGNAVLFSI